MMHSSNARELAAINEKKRIKLETKECERAIKRAAKCGLRHALVYPDNVTLHDETLAYLNVAGYKVSHDAEYQEYKIEW